MDDLRNKLRASVSELNLENGEMVSGRCEDNLQACILDSSRGSPVLGHYFQLPDLPKSFDPDPPTLDSSLPYIPVYTHLKTFDLVPIERPNTPPIIDKLRSGGSIESKNPTKSRSAAILNGRSDGSEDQADPTINYSGRILKYEDNEGTLQDEST